MARRPDDLASRVLLGTLGAYFSDRQDAMAVLVVLLSRTASGRRATLQMLGEDGRRFVLDYPDELSQEDQRAFMTDVWFMVQNRVPEIKVSEFTRDPVGWAWKRLQVQRCYLDSLLHFDCLGGFCGRCRSDLSCLGISLKDAKKKIKAGQKIL